MKNFLSFVKAEQLDELSNNTIISYRNKVSSVLGRKGQADTNKAWKHSAGLNSARIKLNNLPSRKQFGSDTKQKYYSDRKIELAKQEKRSKEEKDRTAIIKANRKKYGTPQHHSDPSSYDRDSQPMSHAKGANGKMYPDGEWYPKANGKWTRDYP